MAGKHRGPGRKGHVTRGARTTLLPDVDKAVRALAALEHRSLANMVSVLVTEAVGARQRRAKREKGPS